MIKVATNIIQLIFITSIIKKPKTLPITIPPGNQTWNLFNIFVFSFGYNVATNGLQAASTKPFPIPINVVPQNKVQ